MSTIVMVVSIAGKPLMPTTRYGKVRRLLKGGKAKIIGRDPFTIQLLYDTGGYTQPMELCMDTGYQHIGVSLKSERREYISQQRDLLPDEKERHDSARKYRRTRRNRKRYRKPRFDNRRKKDGWLAPSIQNKADRHADLIMRACRAAPVTSIYLEMGQFDIQVLQAVQEGKPIPEGADYQHGERYGTETLRQAVFQRDGYRCLFCGRNAMKDGAVLHMHHAYYWRGQHGNRLSELATCCEKCHTPTNHKEGGRLWGYDKKLPRYTGAAFMNTVRWYIYGQVKSQFPEVSVRVTYGAATKLSRQILGLEKSHANDALAMGRFHPEERVETEYYVKRRRNNRRLEKFYDAKYIDIRDGKKKSGSQIGCNRTNRRESRCSDKNERIYRGQKISKGRRSIRRQRYSLQPGDLVRYKDACFHVIGCQHYGKYVALENGTSVAVRKVTPIRHAGGWVKTAS